MKPTDTPTLTPTSSLAPSASPNIFYYPARQDVDSILKIIEQKQADIETQLLTPKKNIADKNLYSFQGFLSSLRAVSDGTIQGIYFYIGHDVAKARENRKRGLVNIAAFLAHSKTVAIYNSVCDEQNIDGFEGLFPISNSCGQFGMSYQNLRCDIPNMECPPDPGLQMTAVAPLAASNGPPPFFCGPRKYFPSTGYYDAESSTVRNEIPFANRGESIPILFNSD